MKLARYSLANLSIYDRSATRQKLEKMAQKGWMIEKLGAVVWKYKPIQPQKLHFEIVFLPSGSVYEAEPTEAECRLQEFCEQDGWKLAARMGQVQIFYNEQQDPVPIETDPATQVENIQRAVKKSVLPAHLGNLVLGAYMFGFSQWQFFGNPSFAVASPSYVINLLIGTEMLLLSFTELIRYLYWRKKALQMAENGEFYEMHTGKLYSRAIYAVTAAVLILGSWRMSWIFLLALGVVGITMLVQHIATRWMKKRGASEAQNRHLTLALTLAAAIGTMILMCVVIISGVLPDSTKPVGTIEQDGWEMEVYADELPLRLEDFTEVPQTEWSTRKDGSETLAARRIDCIQRPLDAEKDLPSLDYRIIKTRSAWVLEQCKKGQLKRYQDREATEENPWIDYYDPADPAPWKANEAYARMYEDGPACDYLLCYDGFLVELDLDFVPNEAQMGKIGETLMKNLKR